MAIKPIAIGRNANASLSSIDIDDSNGQVYLNSPGLNLNMNSFFTGPAFLGIPTTTSLTSAVDTKVNFNEAFDTDDCFASGRFTPNVEGFYQLNASVHIIAGTNPSANILNIKKTGGTLYRLARSGEPGSSIIGMAGSIVLYFNGTTDYAEVFVFTNGGNGSVETTVGAFSGHLVRSP